MRSVFSSCVVALATTGCLSSATVQSRRDAQAALDRPPWPPPAVGATEENAGPSAASCAALARAVVARHPRVQAGRARVRAALARSRAEGSIPPPQASIEVWDFPIGDPSLADHEGMYMLGVGQEFPAAGARDGRSRAEAEDARAGTSELSEMARELWGQVAHACVDWSAADAMRERLTAHRALLAEMREAMLARYRSGAETLGLVARADAELAAADRLLAEAEEEIAVARGTLHALAGEDVSLPAAAPPLGGEGTPLELEQLLQQAAASRGDLDAAEARRRSAGARADAAAAEASSPSFELRATYMQTPSMRAGLGAMFSMSLPWLWGGASDRHDAAELDLAAAAADSADTGRTLRVEITRAAGRVRALGRSLQLLTERELPAARTALDAERAALAAGDFNLAAWIQAARTVREADVDEARIRGALEKAWVELEYAVGRPLPRVAAQEVAP